MGIDSRDLLARLRIAIKRTLPVPGTIPRVTELISAEKRLREALESDDVTELEHARQAALAALS